MDLNVILRKQIIESENESGYTVTMQFGGKDIRSIGVYLLDEQGNPLLTEDGKFILE